MFGVDAQMAHQLAQRAALVHAGRQDVEVAVGRVQHVAAQRRRGSVDVAGHRVAVAEIGTAPLLRDFLSLQPFEAGQRFGHREFARPYDVDRRLQRLHRLPCGAIDDGRADVGDDVVRYRYRRVGQDGQYGFEAAPGHEHESHFGVGGNALVQAQARFGVAGEEGAVQIGGEEHGEVLSGQVAGSGQRVSGLDRVEGRSFGCAPSTMSKAVEAVRTIGWKRV